MEYRRLTEAARDHGLNERIANLEAHHYSLNINLIELKSDLAFFSGDDERSNACRTQIDGLVDQMMVIERRIEALVALSPRDEIPSDD